MIELNAPTLIAPTGLTPAPALAATDLLSLIPILQATPPASTDSSSPIPLDFSALLTEMIGNGPLDLPAPPAGNAAVATQPEPRGPEPQKAQDAQKIDELAQQPQIVPTSLVPLVPFPIMAVVATTTSPAIEKPASKVDEETTTPPQQNIPPATLPLPELDRAIADVKKFEFIVEKEAVRPQPPPPAAAPAPTEASKPALITTDPIANIQQQQLPPRVVAIQKVEAEAWQPERPKSEQPVAANDTTTSATAFHVTDSSAQSVSFEQSRPAQQVQIPEVPKLQVVRTVAMEVGDSGSEVTIRIQERGGDLVMRLDAASEPLHQDLQASVGSLVHALKQEQIQVSNVEVFRKSPIDRVRRMKETR